MGPDSTETEIDDRDSAIVGHLTGGVLHQFNNVLQGIIGLAEMLDADSSVPEKARTSMKAIRRLGENAAKMVQSLSEIGEVPEEALLDDSEVEAVIAAAVPEAPVKKHSVLVVEDDRLVLNAIVGMLRFLGYSTLAAKNGLEALEIINKAPDQIGLIITDMVMPKMGGLELAEEVLAKYPEIKIVVMTGYLQEEIDFNLDELGLSGWLEKPMTAKRLTQVIESVMPS